MVRSVVLLACFIVFFANAEDDQYQLPNGSAMTFEQVLRTAKDKKINTKDQLCTATPNFYPGIECQRTCTANDKRICHFSFTLEHYQAMGVACANCAGRNIADCYNTHCVTVDGIERGVLTINRQIPGPAIHVCKDDLIVVDVTNNMGGTTATMHWHGFHQRTTPFMDGVPFVTQCPIDFSTTFRYAFPATEGGTQWYHSHTGHHKVDGHFGGLVVRTPASEDPNAALYDEDLPDHMIIVSDWMHENADMFMPGNPTRGIGISPNNVLINGKGVYTDHSTNTVSTAPLSVFRVQRGRKYRFRLINAASHVCPHQLQIEKHSLQVIATDSYNVRPKIFNTIYSESGERYDFVLDANQNQGNYWIRVRAVGPCKEQFTEQFAVLTYYPTSVDIPFLSFPTRQKPSFNEPFERGVTLNNPNATCFDNSDDQFCVTDLESFSSDASIINGVPDHRFFLGFDTYRKQPENLFRTNAYDHFFNIRSNILLVGAVNKLSFHYPSFSLLTEKEKVTDDLFCSENFKPPKCANFPICSCVHRLKIALNSLVELVIIDESDVIRELNHPFHLHGYALTVVDMSQDPVKGRMTTDLARELITSRRLPKIGNQNPPLKDTISVPSRGYTVARFRATNPGFWLMHCHFEWHMAAGMGLILQVGETSQMVNAPPNFPKCGNYMPDTCL